MLSNWKVKVFTLWILWRYNDMTNVWYFSPQENSKILQSDEIRKSLLPSPPKLSFWVCHCLIKITIFSHFQSLTFIDCLTWELFPRPMVWPEPVEGSSNTYNPSAMIFSLLYLLALRELILGSSIFSSCHSCVGKDLQVRSFVINVARSIFKSMALFTFRCIAFVWHAACELQQLDVSSHHSMASLTLLLGALHSVCPYLKVQMMKDSRSPPPSPTYTLFVLGLTQSPPEPEGILDGGIKHGSQHPNLFRFLDPAKILKSSPACLSHEKVNF